MTLIGHIGRVGSVYLGGEFRSFAALCASPRSLRLELLSNAEAAEVRGGPQKKYLLQRDVDGSNYTVAHVDLQLVSTGWQTRRAEVEDVVSIVKTEEIAGRRSRC